MDFYYFSSQIVFISSMELSSCTWCNITACFPLLGPPVILMKLPAFSPSVVSSVATLISEF